MDTVVDYRDILLAELKDRIARNPRYSQNAFARDLGISPSLLCDILQGKKGLSRDSANRIGLRLGMSELDRERFCNLVESRHARLRLKRELALSRITHGHLSDKVKLDGVWKVTYRMSAGGMLPKFWHPKSQMQFFHFSREEYSFFGTHGSNYLTRVRGAWDLSGTILHTETGEREKFGTSRLAHPLAPWLAPRHDLRWLSDTQFALSTPSNSLIASICPSDEALETIWTKLPIDGTAQP